MYAERVERDSSVMEKKKIKSDLINRSMRFFSFRLNSKKRI